MATVRDNEQRQVAGRLTPAELSRLLLVECGRSMTAVEVDTVRRAYLVANRAHRGVKRASGEAYIVHPLAVARWLAERRVVAECVAAALLHDVVEDTPVSLQRLRHSFGPVVASLVDGVTKFEAVEQPDAGDELARRRERKQRQQAETIRKLLLAMAEDPRVALIKLADRLHNIRTLDAVSPERQMRTARETLDIYAPLADRLGLAEIKYEIQDLSLKYLDPERYTWLVERINTEVSARHERTVATTHAIEQVMARQGIDAEVRAKIKHLASVQRRIAPNGIDVSEINDLITYLVLVPERRDCYAALQAIHSQWQHLDARLRDYIGSPKLNGYQSLHTTVFGFEGLFDVHIRTHEMQRVADYGPILLAATQHEARNSRGQSLQWIEQVRSWQRELSLSAIDFVESVRDDLFQDQIFVFTPKGEVKDLASGATVLDMAYRIHSALGEHCVGARVTGNDNMVRLEGRDYPLSSGEIAQIISDDGVTPDASWLRVAHTRHAREAIAHWLHAHDLPTVEPASSDEIAHSDLLRHARLAMCCEPGPEDDIIGVPAKSRLVVHRVGCRYVPAARSLLHVRWETLRPQHYRVSLDITGRDRRGLMHDVAEVLAAANLSLARGGAHAISSRFKATIWITFDVRNPQELHHACQRILGIDGIVSIERRQRLPQRHATERTPAKG